MKKNKDKDTKTDKAKSHVKTKEKIWKRRSQEGGRVRRRKRGSEKV